MKFSAVALALASILAVVASAPPAEAQVAQASKVYRVNTTRLSVRTGPSASQRQVGSLVRDASVYVHRFQAGWAQISYRGARRWVSARYLTRGSTVTPRPRAAARPPTTSASAPAVRSGSGTRSVGNRTLGASVTRSGSVSHASGGSGGNESWALRGKLLGASPQVASGSIRISATAGGATTVKRKRIELLGREFEVSGGRFKKQSLWVNDRTIWRGAVGPIPLAFKIDVGVKAELILRLSRRSVGITAAAALFGAGKVEIDVLIVRGGVKATLNLIEVSMPATYRFSKGSSTTSLEFVISSNVRVGVYVVVGRKIMGIGFEKEYSLDLPFLQFTIREVRVPILSVTVRT